MASEMKPNTELPHPSPRLLYRLGAESGNKAPASDLAIVKIAMDEAAWIGKASIMYICVMNMMPIIPNPNTASPMVGTCKW